MLHLNDIFIWLVYNVIVSSKCLGPEDAVVSRVNKDGATNIGPLVFATHRLRCLVSYLPR